MNRQLKGGKRETKLEGRKEVIVILIVLKTNHRSGWE